MHKLLLLTLMATLVAFAANSQDTIHLGKQPKLKADNQRDDNIVTNRPPQALYAELYGRGLIYSLNYDRRFNKKLTGFGFSAGFGALAIDGEGFIAIPLSINYLAGNKGRYFEAGAGVTFANAGTIAINDFSSGDGVVLATATLGYRRQPVNGGLNFRAGLNFLAGGGVFIPYPYVGLGYNF